MKQPNDNAQLKLRYRILDSIFRFFKKNWLTILIAIPIIIILIWIARMLYNHVHAPSLLDRISNVFSNGWNTITEKATGVWSFLSKKASGFWNGVTNVWSGFIGLFS